MIATQLHTIQVDDNRLVSAGLYRELRGSVVSGSATTLKRSWIVDLESFNVLASDEDEAIEEGYKYIRDMGVKIDQVSEDPFSDEYDDEGNITERRRTSGRK